MASLAEQFAKWNYTNTKPMSLNGNTYFGKCVKVYDGDTCWVAVFFDGPDRPPKRISVRCLGYDSPEMKPKEGTDEEKAAEKKAALECKDTLTRLIFDKVVRVEIGDPKNPSKDDKWGRYLGTIYARDSGEKDDKGTPVTVDCDGCAEGLLNVNEYMLKHTKSVAYSGGTKTAFSERGDEGAARTRKRPKLQASCLGIKSLMDDETRLDVV